MGAVTGRADCVCQMDYVKVLYQSPVSYHFVSLSSGLSIFKGYKGGLPDSSF